MAVASMDMTTEDIWQLIYSVMGNIGIVFSAIFAIKFFSWKRKTRHKMRWNLISIFKWQIIFLLSGVHSRIILVKYEYFFHHATDYYFFPVMVLITYFIVIVLYKFDLVNECELLIPLSLLFCPGMILYVYKKHQTELMRLEAQEREGDPC